MTVSTSWLGALVNSHDRNVFVAFVNSFYSVQWTMLMNMFWRGRSVVLSVCYFVLFICVYVRACIIVAFDVWLVPQAPDICWTVKMQLITIILLLSAEGGGRGWIQ